MTSDVKREGIARKNDQLRKTFTGGRVFLTSGVLNDPNLQHVITAVQQFSDFTEFCDPYGEHDFGKINVDGKEYFFKVDYDSNDYQFEDRILTVMCTDEY
jgi:hypothetical protein